MRRSPPRWRSRRRRSRSRELAGRVGDPARVAGGVEGHSLVQAGARRARRQARRTMRSPRGARARGGRRETLTVARARGHARRRARASGSSGRRRSPSGTSPSARASVRRRRQRAARSARWHGVRMCGAGRRLEAHREHGARYAMEMDFRFLYDARRKLFAIGYNVTPRRSTTRTTTCSRRKHGWRATSRSRRTTCRSSTGSDSGARSPPLALHGARVVERQHVRVPHAAPRHALVSVHAARPDLSRRRAAAHDVCARASRAVGQSRNRRTTCATGLAPISTVAFGVPDLALKRGLGKDVVVAPYATLLALLVEPHEAMRNCRRHSSARRTRFLRIP